MDMADRIKYTFDAIIHLLPTELGGRHTAVKNHYRPNFNFNTDQYFCGEIRFKNNVEWIAPGQSVEATVVMLPARYIPRNIEANYAFQITEGKRIVGTGIVREVMEREIYSDENAVLS